MAIGETHMLSTRTGGFAIGFRRMWGEWQKDLDGLLKWAAANGLGVIDVGSDAPTIGKRIADAGLRIGTADLLDWKGLISPDKAKRAETIAKNAEYIKTATAAGARHFFVAMLPEKPELERKVNFGYMIEGLAELAPVLEKHGGTTAIEGWPGPGALCCTPETLRAMFREVPSRAIGLNYDPSHLIRMGIDPIRFVEEFGDRVCHMHGKDVEILTENLYEFGHEQPGTFTEPFFCGGWAWRYTIPGHGQMRWTKALGILKEKGYTGAICVELEDANFNGSTAKEQQGILAGARFLESC
jgi:sugar phosphate isomerase/epimerase